MPFKTLKKCEPVREVSQDASANRPGPLSTCRAFQASIAFSISKEAVSKNPTVSATAVEASRS